MYTKKNTLNSRSYSVFFEIAQNALKTIEKSKECADNSTQKHDNPYQDRADINYIFFSIPQLRMICFDNAFSALENFLEHLGFILFYDWDSKKKQRHYIDKQKKLLNFRDIIETKHQPLLDYATLEKDWSTLIQSIHPEIHTHKRNPIKHIHAEDHDTKMHVVSSATTMINTDEYNQLTDGTFLSLTDDECINLTKEIETFIQSVHSFIDINRLIFHIYCDNEPDEKSDRRKELLDTFIVYPFANTLYSSTLTALPIAT
jgi:hypothetical protein